MKKQKLQDMSFDDHFLSDTDRAAHFGSGTRHAEEKPRSGAPMHWNERAENLSDSVPDPVEESEQVQTYATNRYGSRFTDNTGEQV